MIATKTMSRYEIREPFLIARDAPRAMPTGRVAVLERHYNDVYKFFLARLAEFDRAASFSVEESARLSSLLAELVKIKSLLQTDNS